MRWSPNTIIRAVTPVAIGGGLATSHLETNDPFTNAAYRIEFKKHPIVGGTLGCNQQGARIAFSPMVSRGGKRISCACTRAPLDPSSGTVTDSTVHWRLVRLPSRGRAGFVYETRMVLWQGRCRFSPRSKSALSGALNASNWQFGAPSGSRGGGIDWAWTGNWDREKWNICSWAWIRPRTVCESSSCAK